MAVPSDHDILLALGDDLPVGIWVARAPSGELIYANRTFTENMGMGVLSDLRASGDAEPYGLCTRDGAPYPESRMPFVRALAERNVIIADDITIRRRDGRRIDVRVIARPVGDPITHVIVTFFDVGREVAAERTRAESEQRLRRAQRLEAIGTLAGGIAHDVNNLIFSIKLIAAELAATDQDPQRRAAMEMIDDITERSATLTRSLLSFTRRGAQRAMPISVNDIVTSLTELLGRTLPGIQLTIELDAADRGTVVGDHAQLEQAIMNLVLHARDAVQGTGRIVVRTGERTSQGEPDAARFVVLEVADDGPGMALELRARVLVPDVAAKLPDPRDLEHPEDNPGRGLEAVLGIARGHGGTLEIDAGLDGRGTTLRLVLPAARRPRPVKPRLSTADLPRGSGLILVVDDDQMVRKVVSGSLGSLGYKTLEAVSGPAAIEIYRKHHAEIRGVVLDMMMPGMPGKAAYLALREVNRNVAVLLMSGHPLNDQVQEILDLGVRSFVTKPYSLAELAAAVAKLVQEP